MQKQEGELCLLDSHLFQGFFKLAKSNSACRAGTSSLTRLGTFVQLTTVSQILHKHGTHQEGPHGQKILLAGSLSFNLRQDQTFYWIVLLCKAVRDIHKMEGSDAP